MATNDQLLAIARAKNKRPEDVTANELIQGGMSFGDANTAINSMAAKFPSTGVATNLGGPTPSAQSLGASVMNRAIATGMSTPTTMQNNATTAKANLGQAFGANPVPGVYNPSAGAPTTTTPTATGPTYKDFFKLSDVVRSGGDLTQTAQSLVNMGIKPVDAVKMAQAYLGAQPGAQTTANPTSDVATKPPTQAPAAAPAPTSTARTWSPRAQTWFDKLEAKFNMTPMTEAEIMASPAYQAQKRVIDLNRVQARNALEQRLSSQGIIRSTPAVQAFAGSDAYYTGQEDALVPEMIAKASARQQQELNNYRNMFGDITGYENTLFNQGISEAGVTGQYNGAPTFNRQVTEAGLTGQYGGNPTMATKATEAALTGKYNGKPTYDAAKDAAAAARQATQDAEATAATRAAYTGKLLLPQDKAVVDEAIAAKAEYEKIKAAGVVEPDPRLTAAALRAANARAKLTALGYADVDTLIGSGVTAAQAQANVGKVGYSKTKTAKEIYAEEIAKLENDIATNPDYGLVANAKASLAKIKADTEAALRRNTGEGGLTPYQQYQIIRDATQDNKADEKDAKRDKERVQDKEDDIRSTNVKSYLDTFTGLQPKVAEYWADLMKVAGTKKPDGSPQTVTDLAPGFGAAYQAPGLLDRDRAWLSLMWASAMSGDKTAQATLNKDFRAKPVY